jgi:hypothetical protein
MAWTPHPTGRIISAADLTPEATPDIYREKPCSDPAANLASVVNSNLDNA